MFVLSSRKYIGKVFSVCGRACKNIFSENIFLRWDPNENLFKKIPRKYTYNTIEHLKIPSGLG